MSKAKTTTADKLDAVEQEVVTNPKYKGRAKPKKKTKAQQAQETKNRSKAQKARHEKARAVLAAKEKAVVAEQALHDQLTQQFRISHWLESRHTQSKTLVQWVQHAKYIREARELAEAYAELVANGPGFRPYHEAMVEFNTMISETKPQALPWLDALNALAAEPLTVEQHQFWISEFDYDSATWSV